MKQILSKLNGFCILLFAVILIGCQSSVQETLISPRFNHVFLNVSDMELSVSFYTTAFDLKVTKEIKKIKRTPLGKEASEIDIYLSFLKFPGQNFVLEIGERKDFVVGNTAANFMHLGIDVADIEAASDRVLKAGGVLIRPIALVETGGIKAKNVFFAGPDGETIELMQMIEGEF